MIEPPPLIHVSPTHFLLRGKRLVNFGGSDYLRMAWDPAVREAVARAACKLGHNSYAASRRTTGNHPLYAELEAALAECAGSEAAVVTPTGYIAPLVAAQGLAPDFTHVLVDAKAHACLHDAAAISGLPVVVFPHGNAAALRDAVRACGRRAKVLAMCDGLSAHLGTITPLEEYLAALPASATLMVDDAHGFCVLGEGGRGSLEHLGLSDPRVLLTATLSKAMGALGGVLFCSRDARDRMITRSHAFAGGSPMSLALVAGALKSLQILRKRGRRLRRQLQANVAPFRELEGVTGVPADAHVGPMFAFAPRTAAAQERLSRRLLREDIYPPLIRYGGGPADCFFRFAISTAHTPAQLGALRNALAASIEP
jgi:7-keto-8-aminopelargonate synthetase-like enzyme